MLLRKAVPMVRHSIGTAFSGNNNYYTLGNDLQHLACISGIVDNLYHNQNNRYGQNNSNYFALPYMRVSPGNSITFSNGFIMLYRRDFVNGDYWSGGSINSPRTITIGNNIYLLRASIQKSEQSRVYIKNNTTGEYLYKGEDV